MLRAAAAAAGTSYLVALVRSSVVLFHAPLCNSVRTAPERALLGTHLCCDAGRPFFARPLSTAAIRPHERAPPSSTVLSGLVACSNPRRALRHLAGAGFHKQLHSIPITYANGLTSDELILMQSNAIISREPISGGRSRLATSLRSARF